MPSSYSSNLLLELMADGENEGLWGDITNTNLEILGRAVSGVTTVTLSGTTHTLTVSQGALSEGHYSVLELGGSPTGTVTVTIDPNTVARIYVVKNSSGEDAIFTQGSGDNVTVANGETKVLYSDGAGASAAVTLVTNTFTDAEQSKLSNIDQGVATTDSPEFAGLTVDTDTLFVDASTNRVGVNNATPATTLDVGGSIYFSSILRGTGGGSAATPSIQPGFDGDTGIFHPASNTIGFSTFGSEAMRIDSSGNLLVGKTALSGSTAGTEIFSVGLGRFVRSGGDVLNLNRLSSDGTIVDFLKDGTSVGSIGVINDDLFIDGSGSFDSGIRFVSNQIRPRSNGSDADNMVNLGGASFRYNDIYATNGTILTSDRNEKQDIEELTEAEQRVAVAAKGLLRKFRWKSAVEEKGDDARIHFGIIAQDLQDAFAAEGLDAGRYGMFISSTWWEAEETYTDDDGVEQTRTNTYDTQEDAPEGAIERTRMGVRYPELLAFIIAAI